MHPRVLTKSPLCPPAIVVAQSQLWEWEISPAPSTLPLHSSHLARPNQKNIDRTSPPSHPHPSLRSPSASNTPSPQTFPRFNDLDAYYTVFFSAFNSGGESLQVSTKVVSLSRRALCCAPLQPVTPRPDYYLPWLSFPDVDNPHQRLVEVEVLAGNNFRQEHIFS